MVVEVVTREILEIFSSQHSGIYKAEISSRRSYCDVRKGYVTGGGAIVGYLLPLEAQERLYVHAGKGAKGG